MGGKERQTAQGWEARMLESWPPARRAYGSGRKLGGEKAEERIQGFEGSRVQVKSLRIGNAHKCWHGHDSGSPFPATAGCGLGLNLPLKDSAQNLSVLSVSSHAKA